MGHSAENHSILIETEQWDTPESSAQVSDEPLADELVQLVGDDLTVDIVQGLLATQYVERHAEVIRHVLPTTGCDDCAVDVHGLFPVHATELPGVTSVHRQDRNGRVVNRFRRVKRGHCLSLIKRVRDQSDHKIGLP